VDDRRPHEITNDAKQVKAIFDSELRKSMNERHWLPLTEAEYDMLQPKSEDERHAWFMKLTLEEKIRRRTFAEQVEEDLNGRPKDSV